MSSDEIPSPGSTFEVEEGAAGDAHAAAEGMDTPERPMWYRALRSTDPNPPIEQVGGFDDLRDHWQRYGVRGLQKLGGVDDTEAWVDLVKFVIGMILEQAEDSGEDAATPDGADGQAVATIEQMQESGDGF